MNVFGPSTIRFVTRTFSALLKIAQRIVLIVAAITFIVPNACAQSIAFTFDDGPRLSQTPLLTSEQRNQAILDALAKHRTTGALFVTVANGADRPDGLALAKAWGQAGHAVGNHTVTHLDLNKTTVTLAQYQKELVDCDAVIRKLPGYRKWFRFAYLREGNTPEKRDGMRAFLDAEGYRNAYVSIDTSDWRLDSKLIEVLNKNPAADTTAVKRAYLAHLWQRASAYRGLAQRLQGRDIPQVILLHHNLINALWLDDAIAMFKSKGWSITTPDAAFMDPIYQLQPDRLVAGQSLLLSMARTLGLAKFDSWERLVDDGDFEIEELKRAGL